MRNGSSADHPGSPIAERLRGEFDRAFAAPATPPVREVTQLLGIRIGGDPFALRLADVLAIHVDRKIVPVPSSAPTLMGIASFRGALAPVHDLRMILGYPARTVTRWLVLVAGATPTGLAFDAFDGQLSTPLGSEPASGGGKPATAAQLRHSELTRGLVTAGDVIRPLIDVAAVLTAVGCRPVTATRNKER